MKKYLKNGLSILTCVAMCVQSPLAVLAEDATEVQNEMQSETPVVQPTDLQTLDQQIATYANESNQSEIFCTVMGDPNLNKEHIESHTKTFVKVKGDDNKDHYKLSDESQQYVDGIYEIRFNDGCIWKLHFDKNGYLNTGWQNDNGSWYYFDPNYFLAIRDTPYQITDESNNTWVYYFDRDGIMQTEYWYPREVGIWSYFDKDGHMVYGWNQIAYDQKDYQTHYFDSEGIELVGWQKIDGKWYYFDKNVETYGIMETGWLLYENTWYYLKATGEMASDEWVDGGKYYVDANGVYIPGKVKVTGSWLKDNTGWWYRNTDGTYPRNQWQYIDGNWYHFDQNGYMQTGWLQLGNTWYYLKPSGAMAIGWEKVGGDWYYLNSSGAMQTGWLQLGNTWYYLKSSGAMASNEWVDGGVYYVDANGIYIPGKTQTTGSWQKDNTGWWYRNADGSYPRNKWEEINSKWYHFNTSGYMETGWITTEDLWYHLAESGELTCGYPNGGETVKLTKTVNATCTTDGYQEYTCSKCGETHQVILPKTGHNYQVSKKVDATCTTDGYDVYTCSNCKDTYTKTTQQKLGHDFSKKIDHKDSTCTVKGFDLYQCSRCNETKKTELALVDHNYQLTKTVKATCTTDGYKEYTCSMCNKSYQEKLPKTGHNYQVSKKVDATCTADGYDVYTCSNCKDTYTKTTQQKLGHDFSKKINHKDSTCTVKGFDLYQCSRCDETKKTELALVDHNYQLTKTVKATCTADGYKEYTCSMCNKSYQEKLPKTGHDYDMNTEVERVDSTCSTHGHVNYACKVCGDIKTVKLDLNPENHSYTETGRDLQYIYYKCSECGAEKKEFNDQEYTIDLGNGKTTTVVGHFDLEMRDKILEIINEKRGRFEIPLLSLPGDATPLQDAANTRAIEITYSYSHTRPNGNRAITDLYAYAHTDAENLAKGQQSAEQVCNDWFSSDTHNRNIVNRSYRTIGISVFCQKLAEDDYVNNFSQLFSTLEHY